MNGWMNGGLLRLVIVKRVREIESDGWCMNVDMDLAVIVGRKEGTKEQRS